MKIFKLLFCTAFFSMMVAGCSNSEDDNNNQNSNPEFAMTWKMNGVEYKRNNTWGTNEASSNFYSYYPDEEFIYLQGTGTLTNFDGIEIGLVIKRTDLVVGTYPVSNATDMVTTHIDLINNANDEFEFTREGSITITEVNTTTKRVKGTFNFKTSDSYEEVPYTVNYDITEGTFDYRYDVED